MTREEFWQLIEESRNQTDQASWLEAELRASGKKVILAFEDNLRRVMLDASNFRILAANFVLTSYVSDDGFEDFRAWLVQQGQKHFEAALADPESIADWLNVEDTEDINGEWLHMLAYTILDDTGEVDELYDKVDVPRDIELDMPWPDSKAEYRKMYPRLVDKFWNQQRINDLHSD